ncbi:hypothetical protein V6V47_02535 [Micromonospora sp. CPCC 205539]
MAGMREPTFLVLTAVDGETARLRHLTTAAEARLRHLRSRPA